MSDEEVPWCTVDIKTLDQDERICDAAKPNNKKDKVKVRMMTNMFK